MSDAIMSILPPPAIALLVGVVMRLLTHIKIDLRVQIGGEIEHRPRV